MSGHRVLYGRHRGEQPDVLEGPRDAVPGDHVRPGVRDVRGAEKDPALGGPVQPGQHVEQRRLPGAVRPDQRDNRVLGEVDRDVVYGHKPPELLRDALRAQDGGSGQSGRIGASGRSEALGRVHAPSPAPPGASASCASSAAISAVSSSRRRRSGIKPFGPSTIMITRRNPKIPNSTWVSWKCTPNLLGRLFSTSGISKLLMYPRASPPKTAPQLVPSHPMITIA